MRWYLPRRTLLLLIASQLMAVLPTWNRVGWVLVVLNLFCLAWCSGICLGRFGQPPRWLLVLLALAGAVTLAFSLPGKGVYLAMVSLLVLGYSLKVLEIKAPRDLFALVLFGLFLLATNLVRYQSMAMALYLLLAALMQLAVLVSLHGGQPWRLQLKGLGRLSIASLPFTLLLFLLLPRLSPLWQMPNAQSATTGLSDVMSPGDFSSLAQSTELAFRAVLPWHPASSGLYWRALTLEDFDGRSWRQASFRQQAEDKSVPFTLSPGQDWTLMMSATSKPWLPVLDGSQPLSSELVLTADRRLVTKTPILKTRQFQLRLAEAKRGQASKRELAYNRRPPPDNPKTLALAQQLRQQYPADAALAQAMNRYFAGSQFRYSLSPPPLGKAAVDQFLFETHTGFCGHYASALAALLRAANIPARIVAGYQGGQYLPEGDFYALYQYDAHAWVEAWLPPQGWVRFDPTAQVAPSRVSGGLSAMAANPAFSAGGGWLWQLKQQPTMKWLRYQAALMDYRWNRWVLNYDSGRRQQLLGWLLGNHNGLSAALLFGGLLLVLLVALHWWTRRDLAPVQKAVSRCYLKGCAKTGLNREPGEAPGDFALRVARLKPQLAEPWQQITALYQQLRYQQSDAGLLKELKRRVRALPRSAKIAP
ncbi:transglutaminase TgpA family protein [Gallaecimonas mangrovi]|uniref:transglutaminase TgpA family protein n=1 Tax=Gallaecimonas mangrovi TaxID=2291597 RepID=UPI000E205D86|nr:DUF3488 and transglutaminase-like domain-containing protein [Gallaecimonas mangrovi]